MDKRVIIGVVVVLVVLLALPVLPKLLEKPPVPDPAADAANEQRLRQAIQAYAVRTGVYPPMLEALVPNYIESLPATSVGDAFLYDPVTGAVRNPNPVVVAAPGAPEPARRGSGPVGGSGPMGEVMTGMGVASELR